MRSVRIATFVAAVMVALVACGGGSGDPTAVVKQAFTLIEQGKFDEIGNLACAAKKADVEKSLNFAASVAEQMPPGFDTQSVIDSMKITISGLDVKEASRSGDTATVQVKATLKITFDEAKIREVMKAYLEQLGQPVDDTVLDAAMSQMSSLLSLEQPLDETTTVVNEGGSWKICG